MDCEIAITHNEVSLKPRTEWKTIDHGGAIEYQLGSHANFPYRLHGNRALCSLHSVSKVSPEAWKLISN